MKQSVFHQFVCSSNSARLHDSARSCSIAGKTSWLTESTLFQFNFMRLFIYWDGQTTESIDLKKLVVLYNAHCYLIDFLNPIRIFIMHMHRQWNPYVFIIHILFSSWAGKRSELPAYKDDRLISMLPLLAPDQPEPAGMGALTE